METHVLTKEKKRKVCQEEGREEQKRIMVKVELQETTKQAINRRNGGTGIREGENERGKGIKAVDKGYQ